MHDLRVVAPGEAIGGHQLVSYASGFLGVAQVAERFDLNVVNYHAPGREVDNGSRIEGLRPAKSIMTWASAEAQAGCV
ncbi:hypothetical protein ATEIFO6365_0004092100 [Aspergillus terreus]|uniref:Uncharacterized protein n=1 Tax=Aspergillus terreus TaxID=33178 RepID=A0A5M3YQI6_ASPTE|nr:hypothetical protein ATETN484_0002094600 [Aspergillus terreus]GFF15802.1 hypothetical protein ATEIFO6365_0004092100 [Aspergillus terreus]